MFSVKYAVAILTLFFTGYTGWIFALFLIWGLVQFLMMLVGAIVTYIKAIVGLAFLFALAPIFFAFILFERTRQIFMGWINQVLGFVFQPVLLFAFLGFYATLIDNALSDMLFKKDTITGADALDFCWAKWFSMPGNIFDIYWWRPQILPDHPAGGDWYGPPPIKIIDIFYFIFLTHLAKNFSEFIEELSSSLAGGSGPGVVKGSSVGSFISHKTGFQGKGMGGAANGAVGGVAGAAKGGWDRMVGNRKGVGEGASNSSTPSNANKEYENKASVLSSKENFSKGVPRQSVSDKPDSVA
jgi:type IV secretory pathway VirB6-like protein